jgi:hypothetical protein
MPEPTEHHSPIETEVATETLADFAERFAELVEEIDRRGITETSTGWDVITTPDSICFHHLPDYPGPDGYTMHRLNDDGLIETANEERYEGLATTEFSLAPEYLCRAHIGTLEAMVLRAKQVDRVESRDRQLNGLH